MVGSALKFGMFSDPGGGNCLQPNSIVKIICAAAIGACLDQERRAKVQQQPR